MWPEVVSSHKKRLASASRDSYRLWDFWGRQLGGSMSRFESLPRPARCALLAGIWIVFTIVLALSAEAAVRVIQSWRHGSDLTIEELYHIDPATGLRVPVAGFNNGRISINSLGFRGPELKSPKPPNTLRIAFLGASTTFCATLSNDATWPHLVAEALQARLPDRRIDYVNAGVPGYTVQASLKNLVARVAPLHPDVIVIYHATNDLSKFSAELARKEDLAVAEERGDAGLSWLSNYSMLWYLVEKNLTIIRRQRTAERLRGKLNFVPKALAAPFKRDLMTLTARSKEIADHVVLVTFSTRLRAEQTPAERKQAAVTSLYYMPYMTPDGLIEAFAAYNKAIREVADELNVGLIGGKNDIPGDAAHFVDSVHYRRRQPSDGKTRRRWSIGPPRTG
jgi:lysophospholipase L1-like esterase